MLLAVAPSRAATVVDQSQTTNQGAFGALNFNAYSQSFTAGYDNSVGAGIFLSDFVASV